MTNNRHGKVSDGQVQHRHFKERRRCFQCGKLSHIVANCPSKDPHENIDSDFTLAIPEMQDGFENIRTLDSGNSRHLVGNEDWLDDCGVSCSTKNWIASFFTVPYWHVRVLETHEWEFRDCASVRRWPSCYSDARKYVHWVFWPVKGVVC